MEHIAEAQEALAVQLQLPHAAADYLAEAEAARGEWPEAVWQRQGKPDKFCLGPRSRPDDWARYRATCPKTLAVAERLIAALGDQAVEVSFGDVLDYQGKQLLGWHQDNMDTGRHLFTAVLTLSAQGEGRFEWREISEAGRRLGDVVASAVPSEGDLAIHGLACNNALAHRAFWDRGRRLALVLFCRSPEMEAHVRAKGMESKITMRHWWSKEFETTK